MLDISTLQQRWMLCYGTVLVRHRTARPPLVTHMSSRAANCERVRPTGCRVPSGFCNDSAQCAFQIPFVARTVELTDTTSSSLSEVSLSSALFEKHNTRQSDPQLQNCITQRLIFVWFYNSVLDRRFGGGPFCFYQKGYSSLKCWHWDY